MYFNELKVGISIDLAPATIDKKKMLDFAYEYDNLPLHTDEEYAKRTPFGTLLAPGVMSFLCVWAKYLEVDFFGEELLAGKSTKIEWLKPVFAGDVLTAKATITNLTPRSTRNGIAELTIDAFNQKDEKVLVGIVEAIVKCNV
ncbi:MAG: MaoC family dehydratase N-terminal domain-containing protein [Clostridia bacterium]|nr:MaoC family dehydratase N-terminal domain-containing protein [Clostridia bacterium]